MLVKESTFDMYGILDDFPVSAATQTSVDRYCRSGFGDEKIYVVQTPTKAEERCILLATDPGDLVLDPTCGSGNSLCCRTVGAPLDHYPHQLGLRWRWPARV